MDRLDIFNADVGEKLWIEPLSHVAYADKVLSSATGYIPWDYVNSAILYSIYVLKLAAV